MIKTIDIQNVMGFSHFSNPTAFPGITVILGKNDVCKTALLKMMYAIGKSAEVYERQSRQEIKPRMGTILAGKLQSVYGVRGALGDLVRKNGMPKKLAVNMQMKGEHFSSVSFSFGTDTKTSIPSFSFQNKNTSGDDGNYIFIPAKEVLTAFNTIKAVVRQLFYPGWDDTTLDLIDLLDVPVSEGPAGEFDDVLQRMRRMFSGELAQINTTERFVYRKNGAEFSLPLTAEGVKHIGVISTLIRNGQIKRGSVLFLDEPEDNLHPSALRQLIKMLALLVTKGVQVFITTHNYFTLKQLQIEARRGEMDVMCVGLRRDEQGTVEAEFANLRDGMPENEIIDESLQMLDEDVNSEMRD